MFDFTELIQYQILADGTCSYCGREADYFDLPDGETIASDECESCESHNQEIKAMAILESQLLNNN